MNNNRREEQGDIINIVEFFQIQHSKENMLAVCRVTDNKQVPKFNSFIYLNNKQVGKVSEVFGPLRQFYVAFRGIDGFNVTSIQANTLLGIKTGQLLPIERFKPQIAAVKPLIKQKFGVQGRKPGGPGGFNKFGNNGGQNRFGGQNKFCGSSQNRFSGSSSNSRPPSNNYGQNRSSSNDSRGNNNNRFQNYSQNRNYSNQK